MPAARSRARSCRRNMMARSRRTKSSSSPPTWPPPPPRSALTPIARSTALARRSRSTCSRPTCPASCWARWARITGMSAASSKMPACPLRCRPTTADRQKAFAAVTALKCRRPLPPGRDVALVWGANIAAAGGKIAGAEQRFDYTVRKPFTARFECSRVNAQAGCSPVEKAYVRFTAPIAMSLAAADPHHHRRRQGARAGVRQGRAEESDDQQRHLHRAAAARDRRQADPARRGQGRERPRARQCRAFPARRALRRGAAAGEVRCPLRHPRGEGTGRAARHRAQRRALAPGAQHRDRRQVAPRRRIGRQGRRMAAHGRQGR